MATILSLLVLVVGLASLVCWIMVLIKIFKTEGPLYGILGIICSLYALVWGWMNADKQNIRQLMMIWTGLIIVYLAASFGFMMMNGPTR
jgi:hypothetical protein